MNIEVDVDAGVCVGVKRGLDYSPKTATVTERKLSHAMCALRVLRQLLFVYPRYANGGRAARCRRRMGQPPVIHGYASSASEIERLIVRTGFEGTAHQNWHP